MQTVSATMAGEAVGIGVVSPMPAGVGRVHVGQTKRIKVTKVKAHTQKKAQPAVLSKARPAKNAKGKAAKKKAAKAAPMPLRPPQEAIGNLSQTILAPGVVHKCHRGPLNINILDVDLSNPNIEVKPVLAGDTFNRLDEVRDQANKVNAIAAVNANYFKKDGTPLGTLVIDGEWIAGPLYDRISFGMTDTGAVHVDRANLHGTIETSNPAVQNLWVNNINQPRRHGCKLVAYTRRWGSQVKMAYAGVLVAVDASGRVTDKTTQVIGVPYGGFVLSDTKNSPITKLQRGDLVFLEWHEKPQSWTDVVQAVSGGPALIRNGKLFLDLKDENFRKTWTSSSIHARTALGVTRNHHLILATIEGPHTLWDVAKMLSKLGCVEAMNLDGGGSTTMVIDGKIVTRNKNTAQRRVAASLAILPRTHTSSVTSRRYGQYVPQETDLSSIFSAETEPETTLKAMQVADPLTNQIQDHLLNPAVPVMDDSEVREEDARITKQLEMDREAAISNQKKAPEKSRGKFGWMKMKKFKFGDLLEKLPTLPSLY